MGDDHMTKDTYKTAYHYLFNRIDALIEELKEIEPEAEEIFMNSDEFDDELDSAKEEVPSL